MRVLQKRATSFKEFIEIVSELESKKKWELWFRGQANAEWGLVPRLYRSAKVEMGRAEDDEIRERFIVESANLSDVQPRNKWDYYFLMQQHGTPTRLLDWTEGALIGLYFAVRGNQGHYDAAVWAFDPWKLNKKAVARAEVIPPGSPGITKADWRRYDKWLRERFEARGKRWSHLPVAVYPTHITRRISAQQSCFTIHGLDRRGLETIARELGIPLAKIVLPSWAVAPICETLQTCGIEEETVFPDLEGLGKTLSERWTEADQDPVHRGVYSRLRPSKVHKGGVGVFAIRKIKKGTPLFYGDNEEMAWIEKSKLPRRPQSLRQLYSDFAVIKTDMEDKKTRYGCPINFNRLTVSWYLNNSKTANVRCDEHYNFRALRDIERGEELTVDYSTYSE
jgi:hypothetical protein